MQVEETEILTEILQESIDFIDNWFFDMELQDMFREFDMAMEQGYLYE